MITASKAQQLSVGNAVRKSEEALAKIEGDEKFKPLFDHISKCISNAVNRGETECTLTAETLIPLYKGHENDWWQIMLALGFDCTPSFSSNPANERYFISWSKKS